MPGWEGCSAAHVVGPCTGCGGCVGGWVGASSFVRHAGARLPTVRLRPPTLSTLRIQQGKVDPRRRDYTGIFQEMLQRQEELLAANFSLVVMGKGGGRNDAELMRMPAELLDSGLLVHYSSLPFQVLIRGWRGGAGRPAATWFAAHAPRGRLSAESACATPTHALRSTTRRCTPAPQCCPALPLGPITSTRAPPLWAQPSSPARPSWPPPPCCARTSSWGGGSVGGRTHACIHPSTPCLNSSPPPPLLLCSFLDESSVYLTAAEDAASPIDATLAVLALSPAEREARALALAALREQLYDRNLQVLVGVDGWVGWRAEAAGGTRHGTTLTTRHSQSHAHPCSPPPLCARRCCSACWARTSWSSAASTAARRGEKMGVPVSQGHRCACTPRPGPQVRARPPRRFTQGGVPARVHRHEHAGLTPPGGWTCRAAAAIAGQMQRALGDV